MTTHRWLASNSSDRSGLGRSSVLRTSNTPRKSSLGVFPFSSRARPAGATFGGVPESLPPAPSTRDGSRRRVRLTVAYHGARFHGFAANAGVETVAGRLTEAIGRITRSPFELTGAGRTDAGVHGWGQVVSGDLPSETDLGRSDPPSQFAAAALHRRPWGRMDVRRFQRPLQRHLAALSLHDPHLGDPESVPRRHDLACGRAARSRGHVGGFGTPHR